MVVDGICKNSRVRFSQPPSEYILNSMLNGTFGLTIFLLKYYYFIKLVTVQFYFLHLTVKGRIKDEQSHTFSVDYRK